MKAILFAAVALTIPAVHAAEFAHPDAAAIAIQGSGIAEVCRYNNARPAQWVCYDLILRGAKIPVVQTLWQPGPVRISGDVKWAYAQGECEASILTLEGEVDSPLLPPKLDADLIASGLYGVCPGWVPMVPAQ